MEYSFKQFCTKAKKKLGFLRRNLSSCPQYVNEMAYKGLVRPILEYAYPVWDPRGIVVQEELERFRIVQLGLRLATTTLKLKV